MPADQVREQLAFLVKTVAQMLDTLPDVLERDCQLGPTAIERVERGVDAVRGDLAKALEA